VRRTLAIAVGLLTLLGEVGLYQAVAESPTKTDGAWSFRDGDRVALIGGTFIEREQRYGYLETALTIANPDKSITFRNLGWSGDTIGGVSRSGFDPPEAGFKQLVDQVNAVKPTVILVGYGANESFAGKAGLHGFVKGLARLVDALKPTKARFIFIAPLKQENLGPPLPNPEKHNRDVELYAKAIEEFAKRIGGAFVDLDPFGKEGSSPGSIHLTDNGVHLTAFGYWSLAKRLGMDFSVDASFPYYKTGSVTIEDLGLIQLARTPSDATQMVGLYQLSQVERTPRGLRFKFKSSQLRLPVPPGDLAKSEPKGPHRQLTVDSLDDGDYRLEIDGKTILSASRERLAKGVRVDGDPDSNQVEELRQAIIRKNQLFFYRWRPQNITYLLGFRKYEQGNNAVEIPQFDPLVEEQEKKIATLKKPVPHVYELIREEPKGGAK